MGFGVAFLGYCFLLLYQIGLGVIAVPLLMYGFFLASRLNRYFLGASVSAFFMLPRCAIILADRFLSIMQNSLQIEDAYPILNMVTYLLFLFAWLSMIVWHCTAVRQIALENEYPKLASKANNRIYISSVVILAAASAVVLREVIASDASFQFLPVIEYVAIYVVLIMNLLFTHTCLVLITSEKQYEKDKEYAAEQNRLAAERKERDAKKFSRKR